MAGTNSAILAKAEKQISALQEENKKLKEDFSEISTMYHQLVREASHERYDERRVMLLKAQLIQLERQVIALATAQGKRAATLMDVENALTAIANSIRTLLEEQKGVGANLGSITVPRSQLTGIVELAESARLKLYKNIESSNTGNLNRPLLMMDRFVKQSPHEPVTLLDICSGKLEHLNLKHVSKLESQLAQLYKQLMLVRQSLYSVISARDGKRKTPVANREVPAALYERLGAEVSQACSQLNMVTRDLLDLTLLVPAAPWPPLQRPHIQELTTDDVMRVLPTFQRSKAAEGRHIVEALLKCCTLKNHTASLENQALCEELQFHQAVYDLQLDYTQSLFSAIRDGYTEFEANTQKMLCQPLVAILGEYSVLHEEASENSLRTFLAVFKSYAAQLEEAVQILTPSNGKADAGGGKAALSQFGEEFLKSLDSIHSECQHKRDKLISELKQIKDQYKCHTEEMKAMVPEPAQNPGEGEDVELTPKITELKLDGESGDHSPKKTRPGIDCTTKRHKQRPDARGSRKGSLKASPCRPEGDGDVGNWPTEVGSDLKETGKSISPPGTPPQGLCSPQIGRRPMTLAGLTLGTSKLLRRSSSNIPSPTSGSPQSFVSGRNPTSRSRLLLSPVGGTTGMASRSFALPDSRRASITKINQRPKSERNASPSEKVPINQPEWQS